MSSDRDFLISVISIGVNFNLRGSKIRIFLSKDVDKCMSVRALRDAANWTSNNQRHKLLSSNSDLFNFFLSFTRDPSLSWNSRRVFSISFQRIRLTCIIRSRSIRSCVTISRPRRICRYLVVSLDSYSMPSMTRSWFLLKKLKVRYLYLLRDDVLFKLQQTVVSS